MKTREEILAQRAMPPVEIVTETLGQGFIKRFTALEAFEWSQAVDAMRDDSGKIINEPVYHATLVQLSYCDESGALVFKPADIAQIQHSLDYRTIAAIFVESCRVNCLTRGDTLVEVAKARANFQPPKSPTPPPTN